MFVNVKNLVRILQKHDIDTEEIMKSSNKRKQKNNSARILKNIIIKIGPEE